VPTIERPPGPSFLTKAFGLALMILYNPILDRNILTTRKIIIFVTETSNSSH